MFESNLTFKRAFEIAQEREATQRYVAGLSGESQSGGGKQEVCYTNRRMKMTKGIGDWQENVENAIIVEKTLAGPVRSQKGKMSLFFKIRNTIRLEQSGHQSPNQRSARPAADRVCGRCTHHLLSTDTKSEEQSKGYTMFRVEEDL